MKLFVRCFILIFALPFSLSAMQQMLQVTQVERTPSFIQQGRDVMSLLRIPESCSWQSCTAWSFTTSIVVAGLSYRVEGSYFRQEFRVLSLTNDTCVANGDVVRYAEGTDSRLGAFVEISTANVPFVNCVRNIEAVAMGAQTNMLYLAGRGRSMYGDGILICKNLRLRISAPTNSIDFAAAIMNGGLPEVERVNVEPRSTLTWNPTNEEALYWLSRGMQYPAEP